MAWRLTMEYLIDSILQVFSSRLLHFLLNINMLTKIALSFILATSAVIATPVIDFKERATNVQSFKNTRWTYRGFGL